MDVAYPIGCDPTTLIGLPSIVFSFLALSIVGLAGSATAVWLDAHDCDQDAPSLARSSRRIGVAVLGAAVAVIVTLAILRSARLDWDASRLAHSAAFLGDGHFYAEPRAGLVLGTYYGPIGTLFFTPAAAIRNPTWGVLLASGLAALALMAPLCFHLVSAAAAEGIRVPLGAAFLLGASATPPLAAVFTQIHADAPALAFGTLACLLLVPNTAAGVSMRRIAIAGAAAALSVAAKQTMLPLFVALPLWLAYHHKLRTMLAFAIGGASTLVFVGGIVWVLDGFTTPLYHATKLVLAFPVEFSLPAVRAVLGMLMRATIVPVGIILAGWSDKSPRNDAEAPSVQLLFLWVALAELPAALLGVMKYGGNVNSLAPFVLPVWYAALVALSRQWTVPKRRLVFITLTLTVAGLAVAQPAWSAYANSLPLAQTTVGLASAHERAHPGETWFPMNPLVAANHAGRVTHFGPAVYERALAGDSVGDAQWRAFLPRSMRRACWPPGGDPAKDAAMAYLVQRLGGGTVEIVRDLPEWYCVRG